MSKDKKTRIPTTLEIWKGIRKDPTPPGRVIQPKNRSLRDDEDAEEIEQWLGWRGEDLDQYEDWD